MAKKLRGRLSSGTMGFSPIKATGALFYCRSTNRYLFLLRDEDKNSNTWGLVGGRVEEGESVHQALLREMTEEIGSIPKIEKTIPLDLYMSQDNNFEYHTYVCIVDCEFVPVLNHEHKGYCWTVMSGLPKPLHPALFNAINVEEIKTKLNSIQDNFLNIS